MESFEATFVKDYCEESFAEYLSDILMFLKKKNTEYRNLLKERSDLLNKYVRVQDVLENFNTYSLSEDEVSAFKKYFDLQDDCRVIEEREIFMHGMREAYCLLKRLDLLK